MQRAIPIYFAFNDKIVTGVPKVSRGRARLWAEMERFYLLHPTRRSQWLTGVCQKYLTGGRDFGLR